MLANGFAGLMPIPVYLIANWIENKYNEKWRKNSVYFIWCVFDFVLATQKKAMANERKKSTHFTKVDRSRSTGSCSNIDILLEIYFQTYHHLNSYYNVFAQLWQNEQLKAFLHAFFTFIRICFYWSLKVNLLILHRLNGFCLFQSIKCIALFQVSSCLFSIKKCFLLLCLAHQYKIFTSIHESCSIKNLNYLINLSSY